MSSRFQVPRGTFDILPGEAGARARIHDAAASAFERAGYGRIETPAFEATELFARGVGESTDVVQKEMYTLDEGPSESLTLRPEGTAPVCRAYLEHGMHKLPQPVKLWYLSSFYRRERPQAGRYRQFTQIGVEAIGSDDPGVDAEVILLLGELLTITQNNLPVKIVVFDNSSLNFVEVEMKAAGFVNYGTDLENPDFAALAESLGIHGRRVERPDDLAGAVDELLAHDGPALLDVVTARQELSIPPTITAAQAKGFTLYALRTVLSGRGDELVDLAETNLFRRLFD